MKDNLKLTRAAAIAALKSERISLAIATLIAAFALTGVPLAAQSPRYRVVELPTLSPPGAPAASYPSNSRPCCQIIGNSGVIGFTADTPSVDPYCGNPDCFVAHAARWQNGVLTDLRALPGSLSGSYAGAINDLGWIVGGSDKGVIDPLTGGLAARAVLWNGTEPIDLGDFGGNFNLAINLNNLGQVVGAAANAVPEDFPLFAGATQTRAFLWQNNMIHDLGTLGGPDAFAFSINQRGQVAGVSYTDPNETLNGTTQLPTLHAFLWDHGTMTDIPTLGGTLAGPAFFDAPEIVNDRGQVVSVSTLAGDQVLHGFLWDHGTLSDLGTLDANDKYNPNLNVIPDWFTDTGEVVGTSDLPGSQDHHAFLWRNGVMTDLGTLGTNSTAFMLNSAGQIVGRSRTPSGVHAFLWENGDIQDLNDLIPSGSNLLLEEADNINGRGEIVAWAQPPNCSDHYLCGRLVLLIPCSANDPAGCANQVAPMTDSAAVSEQTSSPSRVPSRSWRAFLNQKYKLGRPSD